MSNNRLRAALQALSGGLTTIASYRAHQDEKAEERAFQTETQERQQAFQERLVGKQMEHQSMEADKTRQHASAEGEKDRLFRMDLSKMEMESAERRHAQSMSVQYASLKQQAEQFTASREDKGLDRQLKVHEMQVENAADQYTQLIKAMQEELKALSGDMMLSVNAEQRKAAEDAVRARYAPELAAAREEIDAGMRGYAGTVGVELPSKAEPPGATSGGGEDSAPATDSVPSSGEQEVNGEKVRRAVAAYLREMPAAAKVEPARLKQAFIEYGLNEAEAAEAARKAGFNSIRNLNGIHYQ